MKTNRKAEDQKARFGSGMYIVTQEELEREQRAPLGSYRATRQWGEDRCEALQAEGHKMPLHGEDPELEEISAALYGSIIV